MKHLRLFIAIEPETEVINKVSRFIENHRLNFDLPMKWIESSHLHLTLKFLGSTQQDQVSNIVQALKIAVVSTESFLIQFRNAGIFPTPKNPRIFWIGVDDSSQQLNLLVKRIEETLFQIGLPREKKEYLPHLTVARSRDSHRSQHFRSWCEKSWIGHKEEFGRSIVKTLTLYQSKTLPSGPVYEVLEKIHFS